jgi:ribosome-associated heat shock protein Hsp15
MRQKPAFNSTDGESSDHTRMDAVRIDKWICAARFFKTRGIAAEAVLAGHVHLNRTRVKPSKNVRIGDELEIRIGATLWTVVVEGLSDKRGPATAAQELYSETEASRIAREQEAQQRKLATPPIGADLGARPTKQDRRRLDALRRSQRRG